MMTTKQKLRVDGLLVPPFSSFQTLTDARKRIADIVNLPTRKDDVFVIGYPKSGSHWLNEIVPRLQNSCLDTPHKMIDTFLEYMPDLQELENLPSPRIMTSNIPVKYIPKENNGKIIHSIRNPKDIAESAFYHFTNNEITKDYWLPKWPNFLDDFLRGEIYYGSWFEREKEWEEAARQNPEKILIVYYENVRKNGTETVRRISNFLGTSSDPTFLQAVYECTSEKVKEREKDSKWSFIYRKEEVGDWKSVFTEEQNKKFDQVFNEEMKDSKLKIQWE
ncbi:sulfotransferase 1B1-like isoform X1 [Saccostrea echinata]|uniref:sulfotransferase 1B1-like isoform X1 n=2 Tax=Saccostrea echinata TaxID=191078 RepID=UPI002A8197F4|nr:sulfotransferase 1B1-like isoform X1 [Saccostrea echinata]